MSELPCWACAYDCDQFGTCPDCGAPSWPTQREATTRGVYILQAECGLVKIGISGTVARRITALRRKADERLDVLTVLWGASIYVEIWLHGRFTETCDESFAEAHGLPNHTEWFWPTPALRRLAEDREFIFEGMQWEDALHTGVLR
jgi:hypothetical protein